MAYVADKVKTLPPYLFSEFQKKKKELQKQGVDVIDLGIGAPDLPTPDFIIDRLAEEARKSTNHKYPSYSGDMEFKEAVAAFYKRQYNVKLDPETEILALIGSKEGLANLVQATINPNDKVLIPNPGYPVYQKAVHLAGGKSVELPLDEVNGYRPLYDQVDRKDAQAAKLMFLNYPSNPTAATADFDTFLKAIAFSDKNDLLLVHDAAYDMVTFNNYKSPSVMQVTEAKKHAVEFGSLSKSFNMTGWRIGYVVGNKDVIQALATLKSNIDTSQFTPIQKAAAAALRSDFTAVLKNNQIYQTRMNKLHTGLRDLGFKTEKPNGTIFLWVKVPDGYTSMNYADKLLHEAGVIVTPGVAFGTRGEGYFRVSISVALERLDEVIKRLKQL